jgi:hypothetical protein
MRWDGHVAGQRERRGTHIFWWENLREGDHLGDLGVDGRIILKCIFKMSNVGMAGLI